MSPVDEFASKLQESGVVSAIQIRAARQSLGVDEEATISRLVDLLREQGSINDFQASRIRDGDVGQILVSDYVLLEVIGVGGMGTVFRSHHPILKREFAIKTMLDGISGNSDSVNRFLREVSTAGNLIHPRIIRAVNAGVEHGRIYLAMDYVAGVNLSRLVRDKGPLSLSKTIEFVRQIAEGLSYAHDSGVVHRDIKPSNVLYDPSARGVKILDMGLASMTSPAAGDDATRTGPTSSGQLLGTAGYMAPEQCANPSEAGPQADLYSLGCTMHFLLRGHAPYSGRCAEERVLAQLNEPIPSLCDSSADIPKEVDQVFCRLMAKSPADRYQNARELVADLDRLKSAGVIGESTAELDVVLEDYANHRWTESGVDAAASTVLLNRRTKAGVSVATAAGGLMMAATALVLLLLIVNSAALIPDANETSAGSVPLAIAESLPDQAPPEYPDIPSIDEVSWPARLIPFIFPGRDTISGSGWKLEDQVLTSGRGQATLIHIKYPVPETYRLTMSVKRTAGDSPIYVGLPTGNTHGYFLVDRKGMSSVGLNQNGYMEEFVTSASLPIDQWCTLQFEVTPQRMTFYCDGKKTVEFRGETATMSLPGALTIGKGCGIFIGAKNWKNHVGAFQFRSITLEPNPP